MPEPREGDGMTVGIAASPSTGVIAGEVRSPLDSSQANERPAHRHERGQRHDRTLTRRQRRERMRALVRARRPTKRASMKERDR